MEVVEMEEEEGVIETCDICGRKIRVWWDLPPSDGDYGTVCVHCWDDGEAFNIPLPIWIGLPCEDEKS